MEYGSTDSVITRTLEEYDHETGEIIELFRVRDRETGEEETRMKPTLSPAPPTGRITNFKIPNSIHSPSAAPTGRRRPRATNNTPVSAAAIVFLLPTTVFFYPILSIFLVSIEIALHMWAHKKNKRLQNVNLYYQSPLHIICKEFCASCIDETAKMKITKIQDKRNDKLLKYELEYFRTIVT